MFDYLLQYSKRVSKLLQLLCFLSTAGMSNGHICCQPTANILKDFKLNQMNNGVGSQFFF